MVRSGRAGGGPPRRVPRAIAVLIIAVLAGSGWLASRQIHHGPTTFEGTRISQPTGIPTPPAAFGDVLTTAAEIGAGTRQADSAAIMVGRQSGVRLISFGFVQRYGSGDSARSAPRDRQLLAFKVAPIPGESASKPPQLSIRVGSGERGPLVLTTDFLVAAVPAGAAPVDLVLTDGGAKQSLSLLTGAPAPGNPALTLRRTRTVKLGISRAVVVRVKGRAATPGLTTGTITFARVSLTYWGADGSHPGDPSRALLHVVATVRLAGDSQPFGAEPALISVQIPGSPPVTSRNAAADPKHQVDDVIEVPAAVGSGTITYSGTLVSALGSVTVVTPVTVRFGIGLP